MFSRVPPKIIRRHLPITHRHLPSQPVVNRQTMASVQSISSSVAELGLADHSSAQPPTNSQEPSDQGTTLEDIPKSWRFTSALPPDPKFPTPAASHATARNEIRPRQVSGAAFTWVRPEPVTNPRLLAVSKAAMRDIGLRPDEEFSETFRETVAGNRLLGWDAEKAEGGYPWAQCYGGYQFGTWASQLGDGRAISLFESTNPRTGVRYELQLKGAGITPYSRFADGKAVLRSSIREFVVSEALNALGIPTTRALALTLTPDVRVMRETVESGAIVLRFAPSWLRIGTFDLPYRRRDRALTRKLATYLAEEVFGGWEKLPGRLDNPGSAEEPTSQSPRPPRTGIPLDAVEGPVAEECENRFARLYREVVRRNATTVAAWQAYGFMNGVLNTDNTSVLGLSLDFGPFAFMDSFDPRHTPNHDDHLLRYSYRNQPGIVWWNLVRFGESIAELIGAGPSVDDPIFEKDGIATEELVKEITHRAEAVIERAALEYASVYEMENRRIMACRLGFTEPRDTDVPKLSTPLFTLLADLELDLNHFFRRLSTLSLTNPPTPEAASSEAALFFPPSSSVATDQASHQRLANWLALWRARALEDWPQATTDPAVNNSRISAMKQANPNFVPRNWILDEVIKAVEKDPEADILRRVTHLALNPFEDSWAGKTFDGVVFEGDAEEEKRWIGDVPKFNVGMQCSCSS